jgi:hypothetical protein
VGKTLSYLEQQIFNFGSAEIEQNILKENALFVGARIGSGPLSRCQLKTAMTRLPVLRIRSRIRIRIHRIHIFLGLLDPDPDPLVRGMDPDPDPALDPDPDPSNIMQK